MSKGPEERKMIEHSRNYEKSRRAGTLREKGNTVHEYFIHLLTHFLLSTCGVSGTILGIKTYLVGLLSRRVEFTNSPQSVIRIYMDM